MARPSIVPELKAMLESWLEARAAAWIEQPEGRRVRTRVMQVFIPQTHCSMETDITATHLRK